MSERDDNPGLAPMTRAAQTLTTETRNFVLHQLEAASHETVERLKESAPAGPFVAGAAVLGLFSAASVYRLTTRVLGRLFGPGFGALVGTVGYGVGAAWLASRALTVLQEAPAPLPVETAKATADVVGETAKTVAQSETGAEGTAARSRRPASRGPKNAAADRRGD